VPANSSGVLTLTVRVNNNLENGTPITNTARIAAFENVSAFARLVTTVTSNPELSLVKSDGTSAAAASQSLTYTLAYANTGNARAQGVVITDQIPSNVAFQTCLPTPASCSSLGGGVYSFNLGQVNASAGGAVTVVVRVNNTLPAGVRSITNTARIRTTTAGDDPGNNLATDVDTVSTTPALALSATFSSTTPYPTKIITYTLRYTNTSAMDTTGVVISVTKSPYVSCPNCAAAGWALNGANPDGTSVYTRSIGNLAAGQFGVVTFTVSLPYPFTAEMDGFQNVFAIRDNGPGGLPVATSITNTLLGVPDLVIESVTWPPNGVAISVPFTVTVVVRNEGTGRACNPKTELVVPPSPCGAFTIDAFVDPNVPPPSYGFDSYSEYDEVINQLDPGMTTTVKFQGLIIRPGQDRLLYFKIDNWNCTSLPPPCIPNDARHGLVPENDELNNVLGPLAVPNVQNRVFIPLVLRNH
jgi:uncharacterized repeat protein (TIGR01451 family)